MNAKYVRLAKTIYPYTNGTTAGTYLTTYGTGDVDAALVRSTGVSDSASNAMIGYGYLGADQIIKSSRPSVAIGLHLTAGNKSNDYNGLDRFGRWRELVWTNATDTTRAEDRVYSYDRMGNRLSMNNVPNTAASYYDETYAYDGLNRLAEFHRGKIISGTIPSAWDFYDQSWSYDALGNWRTATTDLDGAGTGQPTRTTASRTVNKANEITAENGVNASNGYTAITSSYDAAGNINYTGKGGNTSAPITYLYDGWNRMYATGSTSTDNQRLYYDGLGRLIRKTVQTAGQTDGTAEEYFYNENRQVVEVRSGTILGGVNANPRERNLWDANYVNAAAITELDLDTSSPSIDRRLYPTWDANFNVTSLIAPHGRSVERYVSSPYGNDPNALNGQNSYGAALVLNGDGDYFDGSDNDESYDWSYDWTGSDYTDFHLGFQGMRYDPESATYITMTRRYLPGQGTFGGRDPLGNAYQDGMNLYQFATSNPLVATDFSGLASTQPTSTPTSQPAIDPVAFSSIINNTMAQKEWGFVRGLNPKYDTEQKGDAVCELNGEYFATVTIVSTPKIDPKVTLNSVVTTDAGTKALGIPDSVQRQINAFNDHIKWHEDQHIADARRIFVPIYAIGFGRGRSRLDAMVAAARAASLVERQKRKEQAKAFDEAAKMLDSTDMPVYTKMIQDAINDALKHLRHEDF